MVAGEILASIMKKFLRALLVVLVALTATFAFVSDDVRDYDAAYICLETLKQSSEGIAAHPHRRAVYDFLLTSSEKRRNPNQSAVAISPMRVSLSTCILLC